MSIIFSPDGQLNVARDASDLPESGSDGSSYSGSMVRCKNLRLNERGKARTRDGSTKLNSTAINTNIWLIEEQSGSRFTFAGTIIYEDESSIATGLTSAQWSAIKYNSFNDTTENVFALNGTDRKRIESSTVYEWGLAAPTSAPTLTSGQASGLTGFYNAKYTYVRKSSGVTIAESDPSPAATSYIELNNGSLAVSVTAPSDSQVTHIRIYRTEANGAIYYRDQDIPFDFYEYGVTQSWEDTDAYISGNAFKFTITDSTHTTENTYTWEKDLSQQTEDQTFYSGEPWYGFTAADYGTYVTLAVAAGIYPISYEDFVDAVG